MGYTLDITRRRYHFDEDGPRITEEEWRALVDRDPELEFRDPHNPLLASWSGVSRYPDPWFDYGDGRIDTKNPDPPIIAKMLGGAAELGARVRGITARSTDRRPNGSTRTRRAGSHGGRPGGGGASRAEPGRRPRDDSARQGAGFLPV